MRKRIAVVSTLAGLAALIAVPMLYARPEAHGDGGRGIAMFGRLARLQDKLDLSDQQVDQIKAVFEDLHTKNQPYREQVRGDRGDAARLLLRDPNDIAGAQSMLDQRIAAEKTMRANMLVATSKALKVLSAEQRAKLEDLMAQRAERRQRMRR
jgi:Spy/CpxP family protein refolding chaperone